MLKGDIMFENIESIENIKIISSFKGNSKTSKSTITKKTNAFYFRTAGTGIYIINNKQYTTKQNEMLFIPKGTTYKFICDESSECRYMSINFDAEIKDAQPRVFSVENFTDKEYMYSHFPNMWKLGNTSEKYKCISMFYSLLSYIANIEAHIFSQNKKFEIIEPGVDYLKNRMFSPTLKSEKLHNLCGISDTYFRKIFILKFGMSPNQYITSKRISQAKAIIDSGNFHSVKQISEAVGYTDPLYFSRAFKKKYGVSPLNMIKEV